MPHFVIDCAENVLTLAPEESVLRAVHTAADATGLFNANDIKVRVRAFKKYAVGNTPKNFLHVFANIMEGRSTAAKAGLSKAIVAKLTALFPDVPVISINIREFEKATYFNRDML